MSDHKHILRLSDEEVNEIKRFARSKLGECKKSGEIIGQQVFSILGLYARVLFYPLGITGPWGITYMEKSVRTGKPFVSINTSIAIDAQVFAAAHELYHIWFDPKQEVLYPSMLDENGEQGDQKSIPELKANRFAADFLVDEDLLSSEMKLYSIKPGQIDMKGILTLAHIFTVPYKTMVKRLFEINAINLQERNVYLNIDKTTIEQLQRKYSIPIPEIDKRIAIDNLVELASLVYEKKLITFEKLEYLLSLSNLKPEDIGISKPKTSITLSDEEIDKLLEE
jgi:Zn-dependent peptidase ImmA (M78 family)